MSLLTDEQRRRFVRDGFLVVEDAFDEGTVEEVREGVWEAIEEDPDDPDSWVGGGYRTADPWDAVDDLSNELTERSYAHAEELVGEGELEDPGEGMSVHLQFPDEMPYGEVARRRTTMGHLDGYGPGFQETGDYGGFTVAATAYLGPVEPGGGGFTVWPGAHWIAADYFSEHSLESPGMHGLLPAVDGDGWDYESFLSDQILPHEVTGPAGTLVLWHNKMVHTAGVNQNDDIRMAAITRFSRPDHDDIYEDAKDKLWKYWPGLDDVDPGVDPRR